MKKIYLMLFCTMILLSGCSTPHDNLSGDSSVSPRTKNDDLTKDAISIMENWLSEDFSFRISFQYINLAYYGMSQETFQEFAEDGSFHFITSRRQWDHTVNFEYSDKMEYYYRYEDDVLVCYMKANDGQPEKAVLTSAQAEEMAASKSLLAGPTGLLPPYLDNFCETDNGYSFSLPLDQVMNSSSLLSTYVQNSFAIYGSGYDSTADINILCNIEVEKETLRPVKLSYDFSELKPYVLSEGALSGEYALDTDFMYMIYEFDYELDQTISVPDEFIP